VAIEGKSTVRTIWGPIILRYLVTDGLHARIVSRYCRHPATKTVVSTSDKVYMKTAFGHNRDIHRFTGDKVIHAANCYDLS
jgi:hypothetical protein